VEAVDDPRERRRKIVYLTPKGHKTVNAIMKKIKLTSNWRARDAVNRLYSA
jgi:DNA-binding PadR family transcriptional regulator